MARDKRIHWQFNLESNWPCLGRNDCDCDSPRLADDTPYNHFNSLFYSDIYIVPVNSGKHVKYLELIQGDTKLTFAYRYSCDDRLFDLKRHDQLWLAHVLN